MKKATIMKTKSINTTKLISLFTNNATLSKTIAKWMAVNNINTLQKNSLNMLLTSNDNQNTFASQSKA